MILFTGAGLTAEDDPLAVQAPRQHRVLAEIEVGAKPGESMECSLRPPERRHDDDIRHANAALPDERDLTAVWRPGWVRIGRGIPCQPERRLAARLDDVDVVIVR